MPSARTLTSPSPGSGTSTWSSWRTSRGSPYSWVRHARMVGCVTADLSGQGWATITGAGPIGSPGWTGGTIPSRRFGVSGRPGRHDRTWTRPLDAESTRRDGRADPGRCGSAAGGPARPRAAASVRLAPPDARWLRHDDTPASRRSPGSVVRLPMSAAPPSIAEVQAALTAPGEPFEMVETTVRGVPTRVWKNAPRSLGAILAQSRGYGELDFLVYEDEHWSFERHYRAAATLATQLVSRCGVRRGDRVAVVMRNLPEWSVAFWAAAAAGAVVVPLNAWWTGPELAYGLRDSGNDGPDLRPGAPRAARPRARRAPPAPGVRRPTRTRAGCGPAWRRSRSWSATPPTTSSCPRSRSSPTTTRRSSTRRGRPGTPKGSLGTHRNICTNLMSLGFTNARAACRSAASEPPAPAGRPERVPALRAVLPRDGLPLGARRQRRGGQRAGAHAQVGSGAGVGADRAGAGHDLRRCPGHGLAGAWSTPTSPVGTCPVCATSSYGGAPAAPELVRAIEERFPGRTPSNGYGLTETSSVTTINAGLDYLRHPDSVGVPVPVCDVQVVDEQTRALPTRRDRRALDQGPQRRQGLLEQAGGDGCLVHERMAALG